MPLTPANFRNRIELSRQEMSIISQVISRDFSPRFFVSRSAPKSKTQFSAQELLEISRQISREYAPSRATQQSRLVLLAVSPERLHAYWHIAKRRLTQALKRIERQTPMTLRIYTEAKAGLPVDTEETSAAPPLKQTHWFDVTITDDTGQQDIYLPQPIENTHAPVQYRAVLGENVGENLFIPLISSNATATPYPIPLAEREGLAKVITPSIMQGMLPASPNGKSASALGK